MLAFDTAVASGPDLVEAAHAAPHYTSRYSHALRRKRKGAGLVPADEF